MNRDEANGGLVQQEANCMPFKPTKSTGRIFPVHIDLRQRVGTSNLLRWALEAPQALDEPATESLKVRFGDFRPQMMLTLLSFAYASSCYGSEDIERAIESDRTFRYICARIYPDAKAIRRFRRVFRPALDQCLAYVLRGAAMEMTGAAVNAELEQQVLSATAEKIELAVVMDRCATEQ
jgi:hypothetical protein